MHYIVVTPSAPWTNQESHNLRGSPATHAAKPGSVTLCGKDATGWMVQNLSGEKVDELVTCKVCKRAMQREQLQFQVQEYGVELVRIDYADVELRYAAVTLSRCHDYQDESNHVFKEHKPGSRCVCGVMELSPDLKPVQSLAEEIMDVLGFKQIARQAGWDAGTQIMYVPAGQDPELPFVTFKFGFVTTVTSRGAYCRFWNRSRTDLEDESRIQSTLVPFSELIQCRSMSPIVVDAFLQGLYEQ